MQIAYTYVAPAKVRVVSLAYQRTVLLILLINAKRAQHASRLLEFHRVVLAQSLVSNVAQQLSFVHVSFKEYLVLLFV